MEQTKAGKARCPSQTSATHRKHVQSGHSSLQKQQSHRHSADPTSYSSCHGDRRQQQQSEFHWSMTAQPSTSPDHSNTLSSCSSASPPTSYLSSSSTSSRRYLQQPDDQSFFASTSSAATRCHLSTHGTDRYTERRPNSLSPSRRSEHFQGPHREESATPPPEQQLTFSKRFKAAVRDVFRKRHDESDEVIYIEPHHWTDY